MPFLHPHYLSSPFILAKLSGSDVTTDLTGAEATAKAAEWQRLSLYTVFYIFSLNNTIQPDYVFKRNQ